MGYFNSLHDFPVLYFIGKIFKSKVDLKVDCFQEKHPGNRKCALIEKQSSKRSGFQKALKAFM